MKEVLIYVKRSYSMRLLHILIKKSTNEKIKLYVNNSATINRCMYSVWRLFNQHAYP